MKTFRVGFKAAAAGFALTIASFVPTGAGAAFMGYTNTLTFQGVTFNMGAVDAHTLQFQILGALSGPDLVPTNNNWLDITQLIAFEIKGITTGADEITTASASILGGGTIGSANVAKGLNGSALGCAANGGTNGACFDFASSPLNLTDNLELVLNFTGPGAIDFTSPELKVQFGPNLKKPAQPQGDLLSMTIPVPVTAVPEPEIYAMMGVGLGLLGWIGRRKRLKERSAA
jgi:hypothetical protein